MPQQPAIGFFNDRDINQNNAARAFPQTYTFGVTPQTFKASLADIGMGTLSMLWVDNTQSPTPTVIVMAGTGQRLVIAAGVQGFIKLLPYDNLDFSIANAGGAAAIVNLLWLNIAPDSTFLTAPAQGAALGTPFVLSATAAAAILTLTVPALAGRTAYITAVNIIPGGATAAAVVDATLTNISNGGVAQTMHFTVGAPLGAGVAGSNAGDNFFPALPIMPGLSSVLTIPSLGAGNTNVSAYITGYYL